MKCLYEISKVPARIKIGNKANWLKKLAKKNYSIPLTFVIPVYVQREYASNNEYAEACLRLAINDKLDNNGIYAVRSSGEYEDSHEYSFAGQLLTVLDVKGVDNIIKAIKEVWESTQALKDSVYAGKASRGYPDNPGTGVIIQEMIRAEWSGVSFSLNPVNGFSETIIEGIRGRGDALVQEGKTPQRWAFRKETLLQGDLSDSPGEDLLISLSIQISKLKKQFGIDIDVEWLIDRNGKIYFLQCRPVTIKEYPEVYSNHISREVLPGIIKPLVWSINIPLVNAAWIKLLEQMLGPLNISPADLSKSFYYRAYFNMGTLGKIFTLMGFPHNSLERLMGIKYEGEKSSFRPGIKSIKYIPGMLAFLISNINLSKKFKKELEVIIAETDKIKKQLNQSFKIEEYQSCYNDIIQISEKAAYFNIIMPLAMMIFNGSLKKQLDKKGISLADLDFAGDFTELKEYDPQHSIDELADIWMKISEKERNSIASFADLHNNYNNTTINSFSVGTRELLQRFGHLSESGNDFSYKTWSEDPDFVLDLIKKRAESLKLSEDKKTSSKENISIKTNKYRRAGKYRIYREKISSEYTRCYGLLRDLFLISGKHLADHGLINTSEDVFYLDLAEHDQLLMQTGGLKPEEIKSKIKAIKNEITELEDISLPSLIYGNFVPPVAKQDNSILEGVPSSPGFFSGKIVVVKGYQDFDKSVEGSILVIPFSDVGWTPIMVNAGAIISESGGLLSHASIIARELGIPAIVSVENACSIKDGTIATVDANNGILLLNN